METENTSKTGWQKVVCGHVLKVAAITAFLTFSLGSSDVCASIYSLVDWQDPFWQGFAFNSSFNDNESSTQSTRSLILMGAYGWDNGFSLSAEVPVQLAEKQPLLSGADTPRIGGGSSGRIQLDAKFRFWGDARDYIALFAGAGLPLQSDSVYQNSVYNSWYFPLTLSGRIDANRLAFLLSVTDGITTPSSIQFGTLHTYLDLTNSVTASGTISFYPTKNISPFLEYTEQFPSSFQIGLNQDELHAFLLSSVSIGRARIATIGLSAAPFRRSWVLTAGIRYYLFYPLDAPAPLGISGGIRWVF